jgi:hypothetical protein
VIELPDVAVAITQVRDGLDAGMFRGRWAKATPAEQALLTVIAQVADNYGIARTRDITALLHRTTPQLSSTRKALIDKGIIESVGTGLLRYAMPGFADFVLGATQSPRLDRSGPTAELPPASSPRVKRRAAGPRGLPPAQP